MDNTPWLVHGSPAVLAALGLLGMWWEVGRDEQGFNSKRMIRWHTLSLSGVVAAPIMLLRFDLLQWDGLGHSALSQVKLGALLVLLLSMCWMLARTTGWERGSQRGEPLPTREQRLPLRPFIGLSGAALLVVATIGMVQLPQV